MQNPDEMMALAVTAFQHWRTSRANRVVKTPPALQQQAAALRASFSSSKIMKALSVSGTNLKRWGTLFVFINRSKTMVRTLAYDGTGFWLMTKRLSKGKFQGWPKSNPICLRKATDYAIAFYLKLIMNLYLIDTC
jgi:hypothetical protein